MLVSGHLTFPPCGPRTANENNVDSWGLPSTLNCVNAAAWPSIGWLTFLSTEYNCIAPTTRFCCTKEWTESELTHWPTVQWALILVSRWGHFFVRRNGNDCECIVSNRKVRGKFYHELVTWCYKSFRQINFQGENVLDLVHTMAVRTSVVIK